MLYRPKNLFFLIASLALITTVYFTVGLRFNKNGLPMITDIAKAEALTWDGEGDDDDWCTDANWSGNAEPTSLDDVTVDTAVTITTTGCQAEGKLLNFLSLNLGGTNTANLTITANLGTAGDLIIVKGTVTQNNAVQQTLTGGLWVQANGVLTHGNNSTAQSFIVNFSVASSTINGTVTADALGYDGGATGDGKGPGAGIYYAPGGYGGGGAHAGSGGGNLYNDLGGGAYCNITNVDTMGSGGSGGSGTTGGAGGGLIILNVSGTLSVGGGTITADGGNGPYLAAGGAGGGINISASTITGTPTSFTAIGGTGDADYAGGGGGGCVEITYTAVNSILASGVSMYGLNGKYYGGAGLLYIKQSASSYGDLWSINTAAATTTSQIATTLSLNTLNLTYSNFLVTSTAQSITFSGSTNNPFSGSGTGGTLSMRGTLGFTNASYFDNINVSLLSGATFTNPVVFNVTNDGTLTIGSGVTLTANIASVTTSGTLGIYRDATNNRFTSASDLNIQAGTVTLYNYSTTTSALSLDELYMTGGTLNHGNNSTAQTHIVNISAASSTISGASINVNGLGYDGGSGANNGNGPGKGWYYSGGGYGSGAGHGGVGGHAYDDATTVGASYCNIDDVDTIGSGGSGTTAGTSGAGGGLIILNISGVLTVNAATIVANGVDGSAYGAGGAGGGIKITAGTITGTPTSFKITGGAGGGDPYGGGGGGGCAQILYTTSNSISSSGGYFSYAPGVGHDASATEGLFAASQTNTAPTAVVSGAITQTTPTIATATVTVSDVDLDTTSLIVEHSFNNSTWASSTLVVVTEGGGEGNGVTTSTGNIAGIDTNNDGSVTLTIQWNIGADAVNTDDVAVYLRFTSNDATVNGSTVTSDSFAIDTQQPTPQPSAVGFTSVTSSSLKFVYPVTPSVDTNFLEYKIFYGTATGVNESSSSFTSSTDANLRYVNFNTETQSTVILSSLIPSTTYYFKTYAYDTWEHSTSTATESTTTTLSANPTTPTISSLSTSSATLTWGANNNPATVDYYITGNNSFTPITVENAVTTPLTGLTPNTSYTFNVQSINADLSKNSTISATATTTVPVDITSPIVSSLTTSTLTISWTDSLNGGTPIYQISGGASTVTTTNVTKGLTGLTPNTAYTFTVKVEKPDGLTYTTGLSATVTTTHSNTPSSLAGTADTVNTKINLTWSGDSTDYYVENTTNSTNSGWLNAVTTYTATGLTCNTDYIFQVKGRNSESVETNYSDTVTVKTAACIVTTDTTSNSSGGVIILPPAPTFGSIPVSISTNATTVSSRIINLKFNSSDSAYVAISENSNFTNASWQTYTPTKSFTLSPNNGLKTVYLKFRTANGGESKTYSQQVTLNATTTFTVPTITTPTSPTINPVVTSNNYIFKNFLRRGMNNNEVKQLQLKLQQLGYFPKTIFANGNFGPATEKAVKDFQKANRLTPYPGYVGPGTRTALNNL